MWRTVRIIKNVPKFGGFVALRQVLFFHPKVCGYFDPLSTEVKMYIELISKSMILHVIEMILKSMIHT